MFTRKFYFRNLVFAMIAFSWIETTATSLQAATMIVNPGIIGGQTNNPFLASIVLTPADPTLDIVFDAMKHVVVTEYGWARTPIAGNPQVAPGAFWLTDMNGIEIPGTRETSNQFLLGLTRTPSSPVIAHDFHLDFALQQNTTINVILKGTVGVWVPEPASLTGLSILSSVGIFLRRRKGVLRGAGATLA